MFLPFPCIVSFALFCRFFRAEARSPFLSLQFYHRIRNIRFSGPDCPYSSSSLVRFVFPVRRPRPPEVLTRPGRCATVREIFLGRIRPGRARYSCVAERVPEEIVETASPRDSDGHPQGLLLYHPSRFGAKERLGREMAVLRSILLSLNPLDPHPLPSSLYRDLLQSRSLLVPKEKINLLSIARVEELGLCITILQRNESNRTEIAWREVHVRRTNDWGLLYPPKPPQPPLVCSQDPRGSDVLFSKKST